MKTGLPTTLQASYVVYSLSTTKEPEVNLSKMEGRDEHLKMSCDVQMFCGTHLTNLPYNDYIYKHVPMKNKTIIITR